MSYEINVSLNGRHYFATHTRSLTYEPDALALFEHFKKLFPESEGYELTLWKKRTASNMIKTTKKGN